MDPEAYIEMLREAIHKWGYGTQALIWIEEMAELIQSIAKLDRKINPSSGLQVAEELADVDICLDQMKLVFPEYQEFKIQKVKRLKGLVYR